MSSLRKGRMISRWAPEPDDWRDSAACRGMMTTEINPIMCHVDCEVQAQCAALADKLAAELFADTRGEVKLAGVWGGERRGPEPGERGHGLNGGRYRRGEKPVNGGECSSDGCVKDAYRRGMCSAHYQRMMKARRP